MKYLALYALAALSITMTLSYASARTARGDAIRQCISQAHKIVPQPTGPDDPDTKARADVYSACMRKMGLRP
ncbi:hypothetical protein QBC99_002626 [Beijerinckia sp. GAS462]|nr:hypothetical protein [Beijerinckia sp. GAS462]SEC50436.1 hypothetical protein SAMN05443249_2847 [Beijerinckia sp. 28-YEA-48]